MPAAAVIPAPIAYIKVVAVKKLVVELLVIDVLPHGLKCYHYPLRFINTHFVGRLCNQAIYFEKIRVFQAGDLLEYISME